MRLALLRKSHKIDLLSAAQLRLFLSSLVPPPPPAVALRSQAAGRVVVALIAFIAAVFPVESKAQDHKKPAELEGQTRTLLSDGRWLLVGGRLANGTFASSGIFDPTTNYTTRITGRERVFHSATVLPDGKVLIFGGFSGGGIGGGGQMIAALELFDPENSGFSKVADSGGLAPRAYHSATLLTDGRVLIAGGTSDENGSHLNLDSAILWDPATQRSSGGAIRMLQPRARPSARLMSDGTVMVTSRGSAQPEMFEPSLGVFMAAPDSAQIASPSEPARVAGTEPADHTVPFNGRVGIRFSRPVSVSSGKTFRLVSGGQQISARVVLAEQGRLAFLTPAASLIPGSRFSIEVDGAVDDAGNPVPYLSLPFTTSRDALTGLAPAATDPNTVKSVKEFVICINKELGPKATTDIGDSVTACIPQNCKVTVTMSGQSLQPACSLGIAVGGELIIKFPRVILDCPGPAADKRFRPSFALCPNRTTGDPPKLLLHRVEIGEDNAAVTFAKEREDGKGNLIMADIEIPPGAKLAAVTYGTVTSRGTGKDTAGTIGCEFFCHIAPAPPKADKGVLQFHPPINPVGNFGGNDLAALVLYTNIAGYVGLDNVPANSKPPNGTAQKNFKPVCDAITANKAKINAADPSIKLATLDVADKLCTSLLGKVQ